MAVVATLILGAGLAAEVEFRGPDFGKNGVLLFSARTVLPGGTSYDGLFAADPASGSMRSLSFYPESVSMVDAGRRLEIRNRFGIFRTDLDLRNPAAVPGFPAFDRGSAIVSGSLPPSVTSPDGAWILGTEPTSAAFARLVLFDTKTGARTTAIDKIEYSLEQIPARWSPDSRYFVYAKGGSLYYFAMEQLLAGRILDEDFRRIGDGRIESLRWASDASLYYLRDTTLYRILPAEFFTQALYQGIAGMGSLAGKTPFPYDPNFDDFWVSADGKRIIFSKGGRSLFLVYLDPDDYGSKARVNALPHLFLQGGTRVRSVLWPAGGSVTVFTGTIRGGSTSSGAFRFAAPADPAELDLAPAVNELDASGAVEIALSPEGDKVALVSDKGVVVRAYDTWKPLAELAAPGALHALWRDQGRLVIAGRDYTETWDLGTGARALISLSRVEDFGWSDDGAMIAKVGDQTWRRSPPLLGKASQTSPLLPGAAAAPPIAAWEKATVPGHRDPSTSSSDWRAYLDALSSGPYRNIVMIRAIKDLGTRTLFPVPKTSWAAFPDKDEPRDGLVFDHGSRIRRREVALVFDAATSAEGLVKVLGILADNRVRSTFFVNGEFVRREPGASRLLAGTDHEIGSMFFTNVDPTDVRFRSDQDYLRRGLARAEDEWFQATGKELSLLWHTPYYATNSDILAAGASMNYSFVGRDIDPLDWVGRADATKLPGSYRSAHAIVEDIMARVRPGSIIPIRLGIPEGGRDDYLFNELALLVDDLRGAGYSLVPVSTLIEHAE
jgi:peptidoglycan/xylan/chitin deacetylase (PgdA/CDA1 family)